MQNETRTKVNALVASAMAAALGISGAGVITSSAVAAPGDESGTIKIVSQSGAHGKELTDVAQTYDAYRIFIADVADNGDVSHISWASDSVKAAVEAAVDQFEGKAAGTTSFATAQEAAEYISNNIGNSEPYNGTTVDKTATTGGDADNMGTQLASGTFGQIFAKQLRAANIAPTANFEAGDTGATGLGEGYYLVTSHLDDVSADPASNGDNDAGMSPVFCVVNKEADVEIMEKVSNVPTLDKTAQNVGASDSSGGSSAAVGDKIAYTLDGTLPDNYASYDTFYYKFTDSMGKGMAYDADSLKLYVVNGQNKTEVKSGANDPVVTQPTDAANGSIVWEIPNLKALKDANGEDITVSSSSHIVVEYTATVQAAAATGTAADKQNKAGIEFSNDPTTDGHGTRGEGSDDKPNNPDDPGYDPQGENPPTTTNAMYDLVVNKFDRTDDNEASLAGAVFTIREAGTNGRYIAADGTRAALTADELAADKTGAKKYHHATTNTHGELLVHGLTVGEYILDEVEAPANFDKIAAPITLTITDSNTNSETAGLDASINGGDGDGRDTNGDNKFDKGTRVASVTQTAGQTNQIEVRASNGRVLSLPGTGLDGILVSTIASSVIIVIALGMIISRSRRKDQDEE